MIRAKAPARFVRCTSTLQLSLDLGGGHTIRCSASLQVPRVLGCPQDNLRLAIVYLLTAAQPVPSEELAAIEKALQDTGAEVRALSYVRKVHSLSQQLSQQQVMGGMLAKDGTAKGSSSATNLLDWADKLYGQSLNAVTAGMKSLLGAGRQLAVTRQVRALACSWLNILPAAARWVMS
eukprot:scaffold3121_cov365-Prasinococcus_capsulatus_cf.AAC.4